jgi:putative transport protein
VEIDVVKLLTDNPILLLFTVIGLGYLVGNLRVAGIEAGPVIGVLLVGLVFGHFGFTVGAGASSFGFALFIFSVGIQAGALTSTPTLAGAQDADNSGLTTMPQQISPSRALENISVGYAITYVFGTVGMILAVRFFPRIAGIDLAAEAEQLARERGLGRGRRRGMRGSLPIVRAYRAPPDLVGKTIAQLHAEHSQVQGKVLKIKRGAKLIDTTPDLVLEDGDVLSFIASIDVHERSRNQGSQEVLDPELLSYQVTAREIIVSDTKVVGKTLKDLDMPSEYGCFATALTRASIELPLDTGLALQKGDRLEVVGKKSNRHRLAEAIGFVERELEQTDMATFAFGMIAGALLGLVTVALGELSIGLGTAGGLLIVGIITRMPGLGHANLRPGAGTRPFRAQGVGVDAVYGGRRTQRRWRCRRRPYLCRADNYPERHSGHTGARAGRLCPGASCTWHESGVAARFDHRGHDQHTSAQRRHRCGAERRARLGLRRDLHLRQCPTYVCRCTDDGAIAFAGTRESVDM